MDQLTEKWIKLARDVKFFNSFYKKLAAIRESGNRDAEIKVNAREQFKLRKKRTFS